MDNLKALLNSTEKDTNFIETINSVWVQKEFSTKDVVVLPILLEHLQLPPFLVDKRYADFTSPDKYEESLSLLLRTLGVY